MKKILTLALLLLLLLGIKSFTFAQSTEIRPGIILPQMSSAQRQALSATNGMLVFDTGTQSYWLRSNGGWTELPKTAANTNFWQQTGSAGNEIKNTNSGGFWSVNPTGLTYSSDNTSNPPTAPVSGAGTRLMWIPARSAFRVGTISNYFGTGVTNWDAANIGLFSFASGYNTKASGDASTAMGWGTTASGNYSTAMGYYTTASGESSTAMGWNTTAIGSGSVAMGNYTTTSGGYSTAMGDNTTASGYASTAMGQSTTASGTNSTAMGLYTTASRNHSTAIGLYNYDNPNAIFTVGNGTAYDNRVNLLTIRGDNNRVGIGVDNPIAPLHVAGQTSVNGGISGRVFNYGTNNLFPYTGIEYPSIVADAAIISKTTIGAFQSITASDARTKTILNRSDNAADLELLKKLQITNYRMKDEGTWGSKTFKKVIAQEVEKIYPEAVSKQKSVIPDIYALAEKVAYDATKKELYISLSKHYDLKVNDNIELIHPERGKIRATIAAVSGNSFTVKDWLYETNKIFVFGREVNDFRVVDYEALSMLGISAIQALAKQNDELQQKVKTLESRFEKLEASLSKSNQ